MKNKFNNSPPSYKIMTFQDVMNSILEDINNNGFLKVSEVEASNHVDNLLYTIDSAATDSPEILEIANYIRGILSPLRNLEESNNNQRAIQLVLEFLEPYQADSSTEERLDGCMFYLDEEIALGSDTTTASTTSPSIDSSLLARSTSSHTVSSPDELYREFRTLSMNHSGVYYAGRVSYGYEESASDKSYFSGEDHSI
jgi:hypothetical protein